MIQRPTLELLAIGFRRCCLQQMADTPGDGCLCADQATITTLSGSENLGNVTTLGRFLAEKETHRTAPD